MRPTGVSPASSAAFRNAVEMTKRDRAELVVATARAPLVEPGRDVVYTVGVDGRITFLSPAFETMTGWPGGAWIGLPLTALMDHADARRTDRVHRAVIEGDRPEAFIVHLRTRTRGSITAELIVAPRIEQGGVIAVAGVVRETSPGVGERCRRLAVKRDAVCCLDGRKRIVALNADAERMFRVSASQVMDQPLTALVSNASQQTVRRDVAEFLACSDCAVEATTIDAVGRRGDGSEFPLRVELARWRTDAGAFVMAILRDTTESQVAHAALHRLNDMQEDTARRIARELHDEAGQLLTPLHIALQEWVRELSASASSPHLQRITDLLDQIEVRLRDLSHELRPMILDDLGLVPALEFLAARFATRTAMRLTVAGSTGGRLPSVVETALYRVAQEALTNVARHAHATAVRLTITRAGLLIHCAVRDNGIGFNAADLRSRRGQPGLGLTVIRERVECLSGTVRIESAPAHGTTLTVAIPLEAAPFRRG